MNLEEVKRLSENEINCLIDDAVKCPLPAGQKPNYCGDLNAAADLEKIVIAKNDDYDRKLMEVVGYDINRPITPRILAITANARQRAEACLLCLSEAK